MPFFLLFVTTILFASGGLELLARGAYIYDRTPAGNPTLITDANGNLISKGNLRFAYDVHNRLTQVTNALGAELARYDYDALGRRVRKTFPDGIVFETTYSGWRELEEYRNGQIAERHSFGLGIDEIVRLELDQDGDGLLEQALVPVYDSAGNLAMLLTPEGRIAGKYSYSPFGDQLKAKVDNVPPSIEQLRLERQPDGVLRLEINLGEAIDGRRISTGFSLAPLPEPQAGTKSTATKQSLAIETYQPIQDGRRARRRVIVTATDPPDAGGEVDLLVGVEAIADLFQNQLAEPFTVRLTVPTAGAAPEVLYSRGTGRLAFAFFEGVGIAEAGQGLTALRSRVFRRGPTVADTEISIGCASYGCELVDDGLRMVDVAPPVSRGGSIVGSSVYIELKPTQLAVNPQIVDDYAARLLAGERLRPIEVVELPDGRRFVLDGHHRYVASQRIGIPVDVRVTRSAGSVGFDWKRFEFEYFAPDLD